MYKMHSRFALLTVFTFLLLFLCACSIMLNKESAQSVSENDLTLTASFQRQDGSLLRELQVDFRSGPVQGTSSLDEQLFPCPKKRRGHIDTLGWRRRGQPHLAAVCDRSGNGRLHGCGRRWLYLGQSRYCAITPAFDVG